MLNVDYQIVINTEKMDYSNIFKSLDKNSYLTNNSVQKQCIASYKEYLINLSMLVKIYSKTYYLVVKNLSQEDDKLLEESFRCMRELQVELMKIKEEQTIYKILYEAINQEDKETFYEN